MPRPTCVIDPQPQSAIKRKLDPRRHRLLHSFLFVPCMRKTHSSSSYVCASVIMFVPLYLPRVLRVTYTPPCLMHNPPRRARFVHPSLLHSLTFAQCLLTKGLTLRTSSRQHQTGIRPFLVPPQGSTQPALGRSSVRNGLTVNGGLIIKVC